MSDKTERTAALDHAARIRAAVELRREQGRARQEAEKERRERIRLALDRLFDDLEAMGRAAEVLGVERRKHRVRLRLDDREIVIQSRPGDEQPDCLEIRATGVEAALSGYLSSEIDRWALRIEHPERDGIPARTQVYALLGMGMTWLIEHGLDLKLGPPADAGPPAGQ